MEQSLETIERRINALGLTEPTIASTGRSDDEILVQLPGEGDPTRAKAVIQAGGQLELRGVDDDQTYPSEAAALAAHGGVLPRRHRAAPAANPTPANGQQAGKSGMSSIACPSSRGKICAMHPQRQAPNYPGQYQVNFSISTSAASRFGPFTESHIGKRMAIVLDHQVQSAPVIKGKIEDSGLIEGNFSQDSAKDLALVYAPALFPPPSNMKKSAPSAHR